MSAQLAMTLDLETPQRRLMVNPADMLVFALAGRAHFTLESRSGMRFTYKVTAAADNKDKTDETRKVWFVGVLTGTDNTSDYTYLGTIRVGQGYLPGRKSTIDPSAASAAAFAWFWAKVTSPKHWEALKQMNFYHEGYCCRCGRMLTVPESIDRGIGPECLKHT